MIQIFSRSWLITKHARSMARFAARSNLKNKTPAASSEEGNDDYLALEVTDGAVPTDLHHSSEEGPVDVTRALPPVRRHRPHEEAVVPATFGYIRLDSDNRVYRHGQYEPTDTDEELGDLSVFPQHDLRLSRRQRRAENDEASAKGHVHSDDTQAADEPCEKAEVSPLYLEQFPASPLDSVLPRPSRATISDSENIKHRDRAWLKEGTEGVQVDEVHGHVISSASPDHASPLSKSGLQDTTSHSRGFKQVYSERMSGSEFFDQQYFDIDKKLPNSCHVSSVGPVNRVDGASADIFEEQYFTPVFSTSSESQTRSVESKDSGDVLSSHYKSDAMGRSVGVYRSAIKLDEEPQHLFEEQYFENVFESTSEEKYMYKYREKILQQHKEKERQLGRDDGGYHDYVGSSPPSVNRVAYPRDSHPSPGDDVDERKLEKKSRVASTHTSSEEKPQIASEKKKRTAVDIAKEIREEFESSEATPNRGKKLRSEVLDISQEPSYVVLQLLKRSVLYNQDDVVALFKPYGLPAHSTSHRCPHKLVSFLPDLARHLNCERLYTVHRIDRDTTGIQLLAKSREMAHKIQTMFHENHVQKTYWAIVKGVPDQPQGVIDIPVGVSRGKGMQRMMLYPVLEGSKISSSAAHALTRYRVLSQVPGCCLLALSPSTGVKHQIRVHLGLGLDCPIIGDHKYSRWDSVRPQKLPGPVLDALGLRQAEVRHIPLHLHARAIYLPDLDVRVTAPLPIFFKRNLRRLKLTRSKVQPQ